MEIIPKKEIRRQFLLYSIFFFVPYKATDTIYCLEHYYENEFISWRKQKWKKREEKNKKEKWKKKNFDEKGLRMELDFLFWLGSDYYTRYTYTLFVVPPPFLTLGPDDAHFYHVT